jgi:prophage regulatory protein
MTHELSNNSNVRLIRLAEVRRRTGLSTSSIYLGMQRREFPQRVGICGSVIGWIEREIDEFILNRIAARAQHTQESESVDEKAS